MDFFGMATGMAKLEMTNLATSVAKSAMNGLADVELDPEEQKQLKKLVTLASVGATFSV